MYKEQYIQYRENTLFQISRMNQSSTLIVFFHGIGDSHLNFSCFFNFSSLNSYDLFIADLLGHGRSSSSQNYSFKVQIDALTAQLSPLINQYKTIIFVPHSMGGIHATLLAANQFSGKIHGIYAIETSITQYGSFIAQEVSKNRNKNIAFSSWFQNFCNTIYSNSKLEQETFRTYYVGLRLVREAAFLENALEMFTLATTLIDKPFTHKIGEIFSSLPIPKVYCLGEKGKQLSSIPFLKQNNITIEYFPTDSHWVAQTCFMEFCHRLDSFVRSVQSSHS
jgi:pimeloyl-ACP methyl ester carboxylesterase